jgi:hypothetical protein
VEVMEKVDISSDKVEAVKLENKVTVKEFMAYVTKELKSVFFYLFVRITRIYICVRIYLDIYRFRYI